MLFKNPSNPLWHNYFLNSWLENLYFVFDNFIFGKVSTMTKLCFIWFSWVIHFKSIWPWIDIVGSAYKWIFWSPQSVILVTKHVCIYVRRPECYEMCFCYSTISSSSSSSISPCKFLKVKSSADACLLSSVVKVAFHKCSIARGPWNESTTGSKKEDSICIFSALLYRE